MTPSLVTLLAQVEAKVEVAMAAPSNVVETIGSGDTLNKQAHAPKPAELLPGSIMALCVQLEQDWLAFPQWWQRPRVWRDKCWGLLF